MPVVVVVVRVAPVALCRVCGVGVLTVNPWNGQSTTVSVYVTRSSTQSHSLVVWCVAQAVAEAAAGVVVVVVVARLAVSLARTATPAKAVRCLVSVGAAVTGR